LSDIGEELFINVFKKLKAARLEGFVFEVVAHDNILQGLIRHGWRIADGMVLKTLHYGSPVFYFLPYNDTIYEVMDILRRNKQTVREMVIEDGSVKVLHDLDGKKLREPSVMPVIRSQIKAKELASEERCRQMWKAFASKRADFCVKVAKEVLIKDCFFRFVWDLDKFLISPEGQVVHLEIKHKYPATMSFQSYGFNTNSIGTIRTLQGCNIPSFHLVLSKPYWDKDKSSAYLLNDPKAQEHALWVMTNLRWPTSFGEPCEADEHTSMDGETKVDTTELILNRWRLLGKYSDPIEALVANFLRCVYSNTQADLEIVTWGMLTFHRQAS